MRGVARASALAGLAAALLALACSRNPVIGEWEIDPDQNTRGVLLAVEAAEMKSLTFSSDAVASPGTEIPVEYVVEEGVVFEGHCRMAKPGPITEIAGRDLAVVPLER